MHIIQYTTHQHHITLLLTVQPDVPQTQTFRECLTWHALGRNCMVSFLQHWFVAVAGRSCTQELIPDLATYPSADNCMTISTQCAYRNWNVFRPQLLMCMQCEGIAWGAGLLWVWGVQLLCTWDCQVMRSLKKRLNGPNQTSWRAFVHASSLV